MEINELLQSISDEDLEFAVKEIYNLEEEQSLDFKKTISLYEIYNKIDEHYQLDNKEYLHLITICLKEYSFRKAGLK